ncbi:hypothetical protein ig2599ANME_0852 [groundwater metagenome]
MQNYGKILSCLVAVGILMSVMPAVVAEGAPDRSNEVPDGYISSSGTISHGHAITYISIFAEADPNIPPLKWPLNGTLSDRTILLDFGANWTYGECPYGVYKKHVGIDVTAIKGENVSAAEDGEVEAKVSDSKHPEWKYGIVIEHSGVNNFTTVYWHIDPIVNEGDHVTKGQKIGTIANIAPYAIHLHFGVRNSSYSDIATRGALPQTDCGGYPAFPEYFIDPKTGSVLKNVTFIYV